MRDSFHRAAHVCPWLHSFVFVLLALFMAPRPAAGQHWSFDARRIALGAVGTSENAAAKQVEERRRYRSIVIPLGLTQTLRDFNIFNPDHDAFDPVRAAEYGVSPIHYTFDRDTGDSGQLFINDIRNGTLNRDLNRYRGFTPADNFVAEGLASPNWGKMFVVDGERAGLYQGVYVGAGPYFSAQTESQVDGALIDLLGSSQDTYLPNSTFRASDRTVSQLALAITGGYRARFALPGRAAPGTDEIDGIYLAANYHYLRGFRHDRFDLGMQLDTDAAGLLTVVPDTEPVAIDWTRSDRGSGFAIDVGSVVVVDRWEVGVGVSGIANRLTWRDLEHSVWVLDSLFEGGDFDELELPPLDEERRVELPVHVSTHAGYHADRWSAMAEYAHGYLGNTVHGGLEYRLGQAEVRGGARFGRDRWHPSGGVGFNLTPRFAVDVAVFGTSSNAERRRQAALAISLRIGG